jgi:membrane protein
VVAGAVGTEAGAPSRVKRLRTAVLALVRGMAEHRALDSAALMAFNFFLSLVPLLVLLGFGMGQFVRKRGVDALMGPLLDAVPPASAEMVRHELERMAGASVSSVAPLSGVIFFWLTSSGTHTMMDVFELGSGAKPRPWWKQRAIAVASVVIALATVSVTAWGLLAADESLHHREPADTSIAPGAPSGSASAAVPPRGGPSTKPGPKPARQGKRHLLARVHERWERVIAGVVMLAVGFLGLAVFYRYAVEHPPGVRRRALAGAVTALTSWLLVSWLFGAYVISLGTYAIYYGSLAAVAVLLVWLYLTSLALLLGAEVNALLEGVGAHQS